MTEPASINGTTPDGPYQQVAEDVAWHHRHATALLRQAEMDATRDDETPAHLARLAAAHAAIAQTAQLSLIGAHLARIADAAATLSRRARRIS